MFVVWRKNGGEIITLPPAEAKRYIDLVTPVTTSLLFANPKVKEDYESLLVAAVKYSTIKRVRRYSAPYCKPSAARASQFSSRVSDRNSVRASALVCVTCGTMSGSPSPLLGWQLNSSRISFGSKT